MTIFIQFYRNFNSTTNLKIFTVIKGQGLFVYFLFYKQKDKQMFYDCYRLGVSFKIKIELCKHRSKTKLNNSRFPIHSKLKFKIIPPNKIKSTRNVIFLGINDSNGLFSI